MKYLLLSATLATPALASAAGDNSTRRERNFIVEGNKLYHDERYADAEVAYRKALEIDAMNEIAQFNLAATLLRQGTATGENEKQASQILGKLATDAEDVAIAEKHFTISATSPSTHRIMPRASSFTRTLSGAIQTTTRPVKICVWLN